MRWCADCLLSTVSHSSNINALGRVQTAPITACQALGGQTTDYRMSRPSCTCSTGHKELLLELFLRCGHGGGVGLQPGFQARITHASHGARVGVIGLLILELLTQPLISDHLHTAQLTVQSAPVTQSSVPTFVLLLCAQSPVRDNSQTATLSHASLPVPGAAASAARDGGQWWSCNGCSSARSTSPSGACSSCSSRTIG